MTGPDDGDGGADGSGDDGDDGDPGGPSDVSAGIVIDGTADGASSRGIRGLRMQQPWAKGPWRAWPYLGGRMSHKKRRREMPPPPGEERPLTEGGDVSGDEPGGGRDGVAPADAGPAKDGDTPGEAGSP